MRFSIAASRTQTACPVVDLFLCDEAPQFNCLTAALALCWLHEYRPYKKLTPRLPSQCHILDTFCAGFWKLYRDLLADRDHPSRAQADACRAAFARLFGQTTGSDQLDKRLALTLAKQDHLLMVLSHPEMRLHNNPAELG